MKSDILKEIYHSGIIEKLGIRSNDEELNTLICEMAKRTDIQRIKHEKNHLEDILFLAVNLGQEDGFEQGFLFALQFVLECI